MDKLALRTLLNSLEASRSSLHVLLHIFTGFVVVGLGFDLFVIIKEFRDDWKEFRYGEIHPYENHLPKRPSISLVVLGLLGTALIVSGVAGELYVDVKAGKIETQIREANDNLLSLIIREAGDAKDSALIALDAATKAKDASTSAVTTARGARLEADSFEADIKAAKEQAAAAESHLADALERAAKAEAELTRLKTPRSLVHSEELVAALKRFNGSEYTLNVFMDDESIQFTKAVAGALEAAGWVRKQPAGINLGIPSVEIVFDQGVAGYVPACLATGISISAHAKESLAVLQALPSQSFPKTVQAAIALSSVIARSISPPDERNVASGILDPKPAEGIPMTICVGKKP
jgi:hypothetical protein